MQHAVAAGGSHLHEMKPQSRSQLDPHTDVLFFLSDLKVVMLYRIYPGDVMGEGAETVVKHRRADSKAITIKVLPATEAILQQMQATSQVSPHEFDCQADEMLTTLSLVPGHNQYVTHSTPQQMPQSHTLRTTAFLLVVALSYRS